eukprot:SM000041S15499  [mRNA]  locus=s41:465754:470807:- [translate_table: standard]
MSGMKRFPDSSAGPRGGSRAALFDGIEEGGIRASSSSYSDEIAEQDNERAVDGLQDRVNVLKRLTTDIHEEVHQHNRLLDMMGDGMDATRGMLAGTADRFSKVARQAQNALVVESSQVRMSRPVLLPQSASSTSDRKLMQRMMDLVAHRGSLAPNGGRRYGGSMRCTGAGGWLHIFLVSKARMQTSQLRCLHEKAAAAPADAAPPPQSPPPSTRCRAAWPGGCRTYRPAIGYSAQREEIAVLQALQRRPPREAMAAVVDAPPFQEAPACSICSCTWTTFRRRHHCRNCGKSVCADHSAQSKPIARYGLNFNVRVCDTCDNIMDKPTLPMSSSAMDNTPMPVRDGSETASSSARHGSSTGAEFHREEAQAYQPVVECTCHMPLCICEPPDPPSAPASETTPAPPSSRRVHSSPGSTYIKREVGSGSSSGKASRSSLFPRSTEVILTTTTSCYEPTPEGLREAVKAGDVAAVRELLGKGLTADYQDKQGMTLAHLAAMFNHTEVVMLLMENGACMTKVNSQGETPIDCAPATLGLRMRQKMASISAQ